MYVKDLPIELQELANNNRSKNGGNICIDLHLSSYFRWDHSIEGGSFWSDVYYGRNIKGYKCYPKINYYYFY